MVYRYDYDGIFQVRRTVARVKTNTRKHVHLLNRYIENVVHSKKKIDERMLFMEAAATSYAVREDGTSIYIHVVVEKRTRSTQTFVKQIRKISKTYLKIFVLTRKKSSSFL